MLGQLWGPSRPSYTLGPTVGPSKVCSDMNRISGSIFDELNNGYMQIYNQTCKKEIVDEGLVFISLADGNFHRHFRGDFLTFSDVLDIS